MTYYKLPLKFASFLEKNEIPACEIKDSIAQHIHLINTSYFGECTFNHDFGSSIWEVDFDNLKSRDNLKSLITKSLEKAVNKFEKRLANVTVSVNVIQEEVEGEAANHVKKRVILKVNGKIIKTNEDFLYADFFYIGPLSY